MWGLRWLESLPPITDPKQQLTLPFITFIQGNTFSNQTYFAWYYCSGRKPMVFDILSLIGWRYTDMKSLSNPAPFKVYSMKYAQNHGMFCFTVVFFCYVKGVYTMMWFVNAYSSGYSHCERWVWTCSLQDGKNYESWGYSYALYPHLFVHMRKYIYDWVCKPGFLFTKTRRYLSRLGQTLVNDAFVPHMFIYAHHWLENIDLSIIVMSHECDCVSDRRSRVVEDISTIVIMMTPRHANAFRIRPQMASYADLWCLSEKCLVQTVEWFVISDATTLRWRQWNRYW